ncbi:MAG TPA: NAD+ synthase [Aggregatilinea sp.]|uniref:NAD+ synthase n=1 Tax=Aggregatilinea sp. TaxID=2806333 RepID=UPI002BBEB7DA|nr:NAD+ synthase [Aggregatilinea sp.]HML24784.1 NAD+ synthase [Aggregatilinea sp.]
MPPTHILPRLRINTDTARKILVLFLRDAVTKVGFKRAVIGLSGGIDSALSCYLVAEALGPENVLAVRMPYKTSSPGSLSDAQAVIDALGVQSDTVEITPMVDPLFERFPDITPMRKGNVMARQRMVILYDQSVAFNGLVIGTSNKTETLLGYTTIFGDNAAAVQPITDLYKTQVRQLSRALGMPQSVIDKPPSADLWAGQTDEDELGYTYDTADQLLYLLVDRRYTVDEVVAEGFDRAVVERIWRQVRLNHYKRTMPNVAKVSQRSIGHDFLYLRDWVG